MSSKKIIELANRLEIKLQKHGALFDEDVNNYLFNINVYSEHCLKLLADNPKKAKIIESLGPELEKMYMLLEKIKHLLMKDVDKIN